MAKEETKPTLPSLPKGIRLTRAHLHQACTIAGVTETSLYNHKGFELVWTAEGIFGRNKDSFFIIPLANVIAAYI